MNIKHLHKSHPFVLELIKAAAQYDHVVYDGFAGAGGVSEGFKQAGDYYVVACINHDPNAIASHMANHPRTIHILEDFSKADNDLIVWIFQQIKILNPDVIIHGWYSTDCTNHSGAKGGQPRDADSRTLPEDMYRYVAMFDFDVIWLENVREFLLWGPMIPKVVAEAKGKKKQLYFNIKKHCPVEFFAPYINAGVSVSCPLVVKKKTKKKGSVNFVGKWDIPEPDTKGQDFQLWNEHIKSYGYDSDWRLLNSANYGVPQTRIRLIMQFTRKGVPAYWPAPTHDKKGAKGLPHWVPVKTVLELEDEGDSVLAYKPHSKLGSVPRISSAKTIKRLIKGTTKHALKNDERQFLTSYYSSGGQDTSIEKAGPTIPTKDRCTLASVQFLDKQYNGDGENHQSINTAAGSITGNNKLALSTVFFMDQQYSGGDTDRSISEASGAILANPKQRIVEVERFVTNFQYDNVPASIEDPIKTILASRKHYYIISAQFNNLGNGVDQPGATVIARMDKKPPYLVVTEFGQLAIEVLETDPPHLVEMKQFMARNGIISIKMRMLNKAELKRIQSLPTDYQLKGSETDQKKQIGNAVPSLMVTAIARNYHNQVMALKQLVA